LNKYSIFFFNDFSNTITIKTSFFDFIYSFTNIKVLGFVLFSNYLYHFLLAGLILLLAMIAAIVLTLQKTFVSKTQNVYIQILKDYNNTVLAAS
jgi:NADH-quinone oxidoreductase subunit J